MKCLLLLLAFNLFPPTTMALRAVNSGLGQPVYGPEQLITDYAVLAEGENLKVLPPNFTICSSVSSAAFTTALSFFQLLLPNEKPWLNLFAVAGGTNMTRSMVELMVDYDTNSLGELPLLPLQWSWMHACLALASEENHIAVVINGQKLADEKFTALQGLERPTSLTGRLLLAKMVPVRGIWYQHKGMVANLNIFSGAMSVEKMVARTAGEECGKDDGDVLAWATSQWQLMGDATFTEVTTEDLCRRKSDILVFTEKFPNSEDCMYLCKKLHATGRMASVETGQLFRGLTARPAGLRRSLVGWCGFLSQRQVMFGSTASQRTHWFSPAGNQAVLMIRTLKSAAHITGPTVASLTGHAKIGRLGVSTARAIFHSYHTLQ